MHISRGKHNRLWRRIGESILDSLLMKGWIAKLSYRCGLHGKLSITHYNLRLAPEKQLSTPLKIAFLTDFHAGPSTHTAIFDQAFKAIADLKPDLLLLGGDFVSCKAEYVSHLLPHLSACTPPFGKFAVFGNHDLWKDDAYLNQHLSSAGVTLLVNQQITLTAPFDHISICGIDDPWTGNPDAQLTFTDAKKIRLLLMHAPDGLLSLNQEKFDLAFAGHTHGGQIAFKDGTPILLPPGPLSQKYHQGYFDIAGNGKLIVSRGIGCSNLPIRIYADPELVICNLE